MAQQSAENKFLFVSCLIVMLMGFKTVASLLDEPLDPEKPQINRTVASAPEDKSPTVATANLSFDCAESSDNEVVVQGPLLQIHGKGCHWGTKESPIQIINVSNGYTASVFSMGKAEFRTDLIQLIEGQNNILIEYLNIQGQKQKRQVIVKSSHI